MLVEWAAPFVGIPYQECECLELVRRVYRSVFQVEIPDSQSLIQIARRRRLKDDLTEWEEVGPVSAIPGDVILQWVKQLPHVGVYVGAEGGLPCMLHTDDPPGHSNIARLRGGRLTYLRISTWEPKGNSD